MSNATYVLRKARHMPLTHYALRITHYVLRITYYALRITHYVFRSRLLRM